MVNTSQSLHSIHIENPYKGSKALKNLIIAYILLGNLVVGWLPYLVVEKNKITS